MKSRKALAALYRKQLEDDSLQFLADQRNRFKLGIRELTWERLEVCANAIIYFQKNPAAYSRFKSQEPFCSMHVKPKPYYDVMHFLRSAENDNTRETANRETKAIMLMLEQGVAASAVFETVKRANGVKNILKDEEGSGESDGEKDELSGRVTKGNSKPAIPNGCKSVELTAADDDWNEILEGDKDQIQATIKRTTTSSGWKILTVKRLK